jgi:hypothetical protein
MGTIYTSILMSGPGVRVQNPSFIGTYTWTFCCLLLILVSLKMKANGRAFYIKMTGWTLGRAKK